MNELICIIPARLGSKRLRRKNIRPLNGKPMIAYTIQSALDTELFKDVFVATESSEIQQIAKQYGASVPFLVPEDLCGDDKPSHLPCQYMIDKLGMQTTKTIVLLQPTSPTRSTQDIIEGVRTFKDGKYDFLVSCTEIDPHYFHWAMIKKDTGYAMYFGNKYMKERIYLPDVHRPNGSIKIAKVEKLIEVGNFFGPNLGTIQTPEERSIHVKDQYDFDLASFVLKRHN